MEILETTWWIWLVKLAICVPALVGVGMMVGIVFRDLCDELSGCRDWGDIVIIALFLWFFSLLMLAWIALLIWPVTA